MKSYLKFGKKKSFSINNLGNYTYKWTVLKKRYYNFQVDGVNFEMNFFGPQPLNLFFQIPANAKIEFENCFSI